MQTPQDEAHDRPAPQPWVVRSFVVQPLAFKQPDTASTAAAPEGEQKAPQAESVAPGAPLLVQLRGAILAIAQRQLDNPLVRQSAVPYLACYAPLIATSLFAPHWLTWMMGWISAVALYQVTQLLDETAFASSPSRATLLYALPLQLLLLLWAGAMIAVGRAQDLASTVFPYVCLAWLSVAPALRRKRERVERRWPLGRSFAWAAAAAILAQGLALPSRGFE